MDQSRTMQTESTAGTGTETSSATPDALAPGTRVEVFGSYAGTWSRSPFEVVDVAGDACHLRRLSDGATLPQAVTLDRVRPLRMR